MTVIINLKATTADICEFGYDFGAATSYNRPNEELDFAVKLGMK